MKRERLPNHMSNRLDPTMLAIDVACAVAMAKLDALAEQSLRLADLVAADDVDKLVAVDALYFAAVAADLIRVHGDDHIQEIIAFGFRQMEATR